jgi:hypothetical protein
MLRLMVKNKWKKILMAEMPRDIFEDIYLT